MRDPWSAKRNLYSSSVPKAVAKPKMKWRILPILWGAFKKTSTILGAVILITVFMSTFFISSLATDTAPSLPDEFVLLLPFDGKMADVPSEGSLLDPFAPPSMTMKDFSTAMDRAARDGRVKGVLANLKQGGYSVAHLQEIRQIVKRFRKSGKFAYIYSSSYGEAGNLGTYYIATAFDKIWMQPMGMVGIMGMNVEAPFFREALDKIGVEPQFIKRKEYKSAYESFTDSKISEPNREMMTKLLGDFAQIFAQDISQDRGMSKEAFNALVSKGLFTDEDALKNGLVDELIYGDQVIKKIKEQVTGNPEDEDLLYVDVVDYSNSINPQGDFVEALLEDGAKPKKSKSGKPEVALIYATGAIMQTKTPAQEGIAAADEIAGALLDAGDDEDIKAIVLRIDSPGGSAVASETILRAVSVAKEKGKKVTVSMGPVAASGGYWIAAYADRIFALPTTVTGSIGVLAGKFSAKGLWESLGVNWDRITWGQNAGMWSMNTPFSESEAERMNLLLDSIYDNFVERVAKGRNMTPDQVEKIARGRVWTGKAALDIGLADELGSLDDALDYTARDLGKIDRMDIDVVVMPRPLSSFEKLMQMLEGQAQIGQVIGMQADVLSKVQPWLNEAMIAADPQSHMVYSPIKIQ